MALKRRSNLFRNDDSKKYISEKAMAVHISMLSLNEQSIPEISPMEEDSISIQDCTPNPSDNVKKDIIEDKISDGMKYKDKPAKNKNTEVTTKVNYQQETFAEINDRLVVESTDDEDDYDTKENEYSGTLSFSEILKNRLSRNSVLTPPITNFPSAYNAKDLQVALYVPRPILVQSPDEYSKELSYKNEENQVDSDSKNFDDNFMDISD